MNHVIGIYFIIIKHALINPNLPNRYKRLNRGTKKMHLVRLCHRKRAYMATSAQAATPDWCANGGARGP